MIPTWIANVGGIVLAVLAWATSGPVVSLMPPKWGAVFIAIGALLAAFGIHGGIQRNDKTNGTPPAVSKLK